MNSKAELVITFDFELGWGFVENGQWLDYQKQGIYKDIRVTLPKVLDLLDRYDTAVTWAFVGAMLDEPSLRSFKHLPNQISDLITDFSTKADNETSDARDLFELILQSETNHQFASHTYSHVRFNCPDLTSVSIQKELELFQRVARSYDLNISKLVFPENIEGFYKELGQYEYTDARIGQNYSPYRNRLLHLAQSALMPPPLSFRENITESIVRHTGSMYFSTGPKRIHRMPFVYKQAISGVKKAITENGRLHIWVHPFNFSDTSYLLPWFEKFLAHVSAKREQGLIDIVYF